MIYIFFVIVFTVLFLLFKYSRNNVLGKKEHVNTKISKATLNTKKTLSDPEQTLYWRLVETLDNLIVLPQVSFSRFLYAHGDTKKENFKLNNRVRQKVADYVICDKAFNVKAVIELDDSSHNPKKDSQRDEYLNSAGIIVYRFNVKKIPNKKEITEYILIN